MRRLVALGLLATAGCTRALTPPLTVSAKRDLPSIRTLAVMPASPSASSAATVPAEAPVRVGGMLLEAASRETAWSVVDAKKTQAALESIPPDTLESRTGALATHLGADGALVATIGSYRERVGSAYGVSEPASVSIQFLLVPAGQNQAAWKADYTVTQEPLTYNLWNLWDVVLGGAKWQTTDELARIGIDEAVRRLAAAVGR
ncbi:MAG TPA: hypothetical protein VLF14_04380 [Candidatus Binatia bacterium]|nr:hypothetical protein [Candidatus Binatia bacterium]